jgi:hypothetical protein
MNDLDELLRLHGEATKGHWIAGHVVNGESHVYASRLGPARSVVPIVNGTNAVNSAAIAAAHNALPGLIERVRRAEAMAADANATFAKVGDIEVRNTRDANNLAAIIAERDALREVAEAARDAVANAAGHTPRETHALAIALAKVPR